jgi:exopolyphosphatase/guanosine-5'-triphosphate,3'-diphosphate pyrophosphatase
MRRAVIDLGTNTFNLVIAEVTENTLNVIHTAKEAVLLGMDGINDGIVAPEAMERAMQTLDHFSSICHDYKVEPLEILGIGTSALRDARNANDLIERALKYFGIRIHIISGEDEALLIYRGVKWSYSFAEPAVIMDIGGGSSEFIWANDSEILGMVSLDIGVSRIFQTLGKPHQYSEKDFKTIHQYMDKKENGSLANFHVKTLVGASGSFETFFEMIHKRTFSQGDETIELDMVSLREQLTWVLRSTYQERMDHDWIIPIRKEMLPIAASQIIWILDKLEIEKVVISPYSLKEGALHSTRRKA